MTDISAQPMPSQSAAASIMVGSKGMKKRHAAEARFKAYGIVAIVFSLGVLAFMLFTIFNDGISAFRQAQLTFPVTIDAAVVDPTGTRDRNTMAKVTTFSYTKVLNNSIVAALLDKGIPQEKVSDKELGEMVSKSAPAQVRNMVLADPSLVGQTITISVFANGRIDGYFKGRVTRDTASRDSNVSPAQLDLADTLRDAGILSLGWNSRFLTNSDSSDLRPETAGLGVAILGSLYLMFLVLIICVPIGVAASIYLEEFAPKNRWTDIIEVNISNLAAVPSIVFGILGLALFINFAGLPQSSAMVGALVISLMTLPTIIIASRSAIRAVPPSIRDAALGVGASKMQTVFHHVLPLAAPGILTGTILGLASALGETAPLLLIGMVAFVDNYPGAPISGFFDPATALPVQVYSWASRSDPAFLERSSGAIIVLLVFLVIMNVTAIILRRKFERRW